MFSFLPLTVRLLVPELVEVLELFVDANIFPDFLIVLNCLNFVTNQFLFNLRQLLLMLDTVSMFALAISFRFLCHLQLKLTFHLLTLHVKSVSLFTLFHAPLVVVLLDCLVPLVVSHSNDFTLIALNDLRVDIEQESTC